MRIGMVPHQMTGGIQDSEDMQVGITEDEFLAILRKQGTLRMRFFAEDGAQTRVVEVTVTSITRGIGRVTFAFDKDAS